MLPELPITNYQLRKLKLYLKLAAASIAIILFLGNVIAAIVHDSIVVDSRGYTTRNGFPIFHSESEYIKFVKQHPANMGIRLRIHRMRQGESFWDLTSRYGITIDTLIAANPFMRDLVPAEGHDIVIPSENGVLFPFDTFYDVVRMKKILAPHNAVSGHYLPTPFHLISTDDMRLVFFKHATPEVMNDSMASIYGMRKTFQSPVRGRYTSMFGDRTDPHFHESWFHNGLDIMAPIGRPIKPIMEGIVIFTGWRGGYGNTVMIQHRDGYSSLYGHLSSIRVKEGEWVDKNSRIGTVGSTGRSTGPHLHFTFMRHGETINPLLYIW
ncbi:MAG: peptidoglycan DD-metalloendopeptidase family protein [Spirochaetes bacterium]|nr:peptidoglycan DD-metalloendopeptidase family protein [Spirochaetota bacterium]